MSSTGASCRIGIDLGTSKSGYTYSFDADPRHAGKTPEYWPGESAGEAKTDTALLYVAQSGRWQYDCWGKEALTKYAEAASHDRCQQYRLIRGKQFKLALAQKAADQTLAQKAADLGADFRLPADCPSYFTEATFTEQMLRCLLDHAVVHIRESHNFDIRSTPGVHYCLSVPAGWSDGAKDVIKQAAENAGMVLVPQLDASRSTSSDQATTACSASAVSLVYEQEAAALTACYDPLKSYPTLKALPGQVWVILDAGGGTVDIAMHRVQQSSAAGYSHLQEVTRSRCLLSGASLLDARFEQEVLWPLLGSNSKYQRWKQELPEEHLTTMADWEAKKITFAGKGGITLPLQYGFIRALRTDPPLPSRVSSGRLDISLEDMLSLVFDPVIDPIITHLQEVIFTKRKSDQSDRVDVLLVAGGFGSNKYLRDRVDKEFGARISNIYKPGDGNRMVVLGNTIHLKQPRTILTRCSRLTYGVGAAVKPSADCEKLGNCGWDPKQKGRYCFGHFLVLLAQGEYIEVDGTVKEQTLTPLPGVKQCHVQVYATERPNATHIYEKHVHKVGEVQITVEKSKKTWLGMQVGKQASDDYKIRLRFTFGAAEFTVEAHDVTNNRKLQTKIVFSNRPADTAVFLPA